jgi:hypothetical protein
VKINLYDDEGQTKEVKYPKTTTNKGTRINLNDNDDLDNDFKPYK